MPQVSTIDDWYYRMLGEEFGPVSRSVLDRIIAEGQISAGDEVRAGENGSWIPVSQLESHNTSGSQSTGMLLSLDSLSDADAQPANSANGISTASQDGWFYQSLGVEWGPITFDELLEHAQRGELSPDDQIRMGTGGKWRRAGSMGRLMAVMPYATAAAKAIPTGHKTDDFETSVALKESSQQVVAPKPPPPAPAPPAPLPPAPPPPPPPPPAPIPQMMPPQMMPMAGYGQHPMHPGWGYGQPPIQNPVADMGWYAWLDGVECGPMDFNQIMSWAKSGRISPGDHIKQGKYSQWSLAQSVQGLSFQAPPSPPSPPPAQPAVAGPMPAKPAVAPAVQLPPPPAKTAMTSAPAPAAAPVTAAVPKSAPPVEKPKPDFPSDAPPAKPTSSDWGSSSVKSTYRPGMSAAAATAKKPLAMAKKKSSGGGSFDVNELAKDKRVLVGLGVVLLLVAGWFGKDFLPEGSGKLKAAHAELTKLHKEIEAKKGDSADAAKWKSFGDSMSKKVSNTTKSFGTTKHEARGPLTSAKTALSTALKQKTPEDVDKKLGEAKKKLDDAGKKLGL